MAFSNAVYGVISQVGDRIYQDQGKGREKANTVVVGIGTLIAAVLGGIGYLLQAGIGLPEWVPTAAVWLTLLGTFFGVSKTKNGVTKSVIEEYNRKVADMIDEQQRDAGHPGVPEPTAPTTHPETSAPADAGHAGEIADDLDGLAKRLAGRQG